MHKGPHKMKVDIIVPVTGESVTEGNIARWFKQNGDYVAMDDPVLELETEKATLEVTAEAEGTLTITVNEGETVKVGQAVGFIDTSASGEAESKVNKPEDVKKEISEPAVVRDDSNGNDSDLFDDVSIPSPAARKLMAENNISSTEIKGTGKGGRITKADVINFIQERDKQDAITSSKHKFMNFYESGFPVVSPDETTTLLRKSGDTESDPNQEQKVKEEKIPSKILTKSTESSSNLNDHTQFNRSSNVDKLSRMRKTIAQRLIHAQQSAALLTTFNELDMSAIMDIRKKHKDEFKKTHDVNLGFMSFFTKAACQALNQFPIINSQMDHESITYFDYCDVGIAVSTPKGLVVPVIRNAESLSLFEIEKTILELAAKGRDNKLTISELAGGTFTITNGGVFGSMLSTPIVNAPQSAIMGMHNIVERPVVVNGEITIRPIMYLALTYDHRLVDGSDAVRFLVKIKQQCEDPVKMLLNL